MKTILIIEDEFGIALLLATVLEDEGYRVFMAANGRQGLERLEECRPDLVISDLMMPTMDGATMARTMRADPAYRNIPIIMMSALPEAAVREKFDGYDAFLSKPFLEPILLKTVAGLLDR
ncbi:MAG TPA: response regulator [Arenibaculum sp.]|nr:response regulator [Arenibaculum sp.]